MTTKDKLKISQDKFRKSNPERYKEIQKQSYLRNKEKRILARKLYTIKNSDTIKTTVKSYKKSRHGSRVCREIEAKRRACKLKATPNWSNKDEIKNIYANCPDGYHVDHIVPLQGVNVCGLHVPCNLQYLLAAENIKKKNRVA